MELNHADGQLRSDTADYSYRNTIGIADDPWWDSRFSTAHSNATEDEAFLASTTTGFGCTPPSSNSIGYSQSPHPLSGPPFARARTIHQAVQSPTDLLVTFDAPLAPQLSGPNDSFHSATFDTTIPYHLLGAIGIESAGRGSVPDNPMLPNKFFDVRYVLEQRLQTPILAAETNSYDADCGDSPLGLDQPSSQGGALPVNRADCITSDNPAKSYIHAIDDHRHTQKQHTTYLSSNGKASVEQPWKPSPVWLEGHRLKVLSASDLISSHGLAPQDSALASSSTIPSTSATTSPPLDDNWQCDNCGTVLTTNGTKNRNRNKRRHRCPGTGPKYPCPLCPKSFNRGDTRLLHLRKWHPEIHTKPPRPRKGKDFNERRMN